MIKRKWEESYADYLLQYSLEGIILREKVLLKFEPGEFICIEGKEIGYLFVVVKGKAKVCTTSIDGKVLLLCFYENGGMLGDVELMLDSGDTNTNVQAITDVECIGIPYHLNKSVLKNDVKFMNYVGQSLAKKLNRCSKNCTLTILHPLECRLCSYLSVASEKGIFSEKLTETAELLGTSYRHLLRTLEQLCKENIIERKNGYYSIKNKKLLQLKSDEYYQPYEM